MSLLRLRDRRQARGIIELKVGVSSFSWLSLDDGVNVSEQPINGAGELFRGKLAAVYSSDGTVYFQFGTRRWDLLSRGIAMEWKRINFKLRNRFVLYELRQPVLKIAYWSFRLLSFRDPTFDSVDEACEDFFLWLATVLFPDKDRLRKLSQGWVLLVPRPE